MSRNSILFESVFCESFLISEYSSAPTLTKDWIVEPMDNVDRTLAVQSPLANQFIADFYFKMYYTRRLPVYGVPGLIDHV